MNKDAGAATPSRSRLRIGFIAALEDEAHCLGWRQAATSAVGIRVAGPGQTNAKNAAVTMIDEGYNCLISWGTAGALDGRLSNETLTLYDSCRNDNGKQWQSSTTALRFFSELLKSLSPIHVAALSSTTPLLDPESKQAQFQHSACRVVDMESAAIAQVANAAGISFVAIRAIVDPADFKIPGCALQGMTDDGQTRALPVIVGALRKPSEISQLIKLSAYYRRALDRLRLAAALIEQNLLQDLAAMERAEGALISL